MQRAHRPFRCGLLVSILSITVAGCASVTPLDDASLIDIKTASPDDLTRYHQARESWGRETFGGATFTDNSGRKFPFPAWPGPPKPEWPVVRVAFQSHRLLIDPDDADPIISLSLCGSNGHGETIGVGGSGIMWRGHIVWPAHAAEIKTLIEKTKMPQKYEIFFDYVYRDYTRDQGGEPATILPLPDDFCMALERTNWPIAPPSVGRPLRIGKDIVSAALAPLPRQIPVAPRE